MLKMIPRTKDRQRGKQTTKQNESRTQTKQKQINEKGVIWLLKYIMQVEYEFKEEKG